MSKLLDLRSALRAQAWERAGEILTEAPDLAGRVDGKGRALVGYAAQDGRWGEVDWLLGAGAGWGQAAHGWLRGGLSAPAALEEELKSRCQFEFGSSFEVAGESLLAAALLGRKASMVATLASQEWAGDESGWRRCWFLAIKRFDKLLMDALRESNGASAWKTWMPELAARAMSEGNFEVLSWLCENGLDLGRLSASGSSLLCQAAGSNNEAAVDWLLARGAPVDALDGDGHSALYRAVARGSEPAARALLAVGANPELRQGVRGHGCSPLRLAKRQGAREMRQLLGAALEGAALARQTVALPAGPRAVRL